MPKNDPHYRSKNSIRIENSQVLAEGESPVDLRSDKQLRKALKKTGKLLDLGSLELSASSKIPKGLEFLAGIPEFAEFRLKMTEAEFQNIIKRQSLTIESDTRRKGRTSYTLSTALGKNVIVMFHDGQCSGIQGMRDTPVGVGSKHGLPKMVAVTSKEVGVTFDRPADWILDPNRGPNSPSVDFLQPWSMVESVQGSIRVSMVEVGGPTSIDVTTAPDAKSIAHRIFTIDGHPARLTASNMSKDTGHLSVDVAKGTRLYTLQMVYPAKEHDEYVRLALAVSKSMRLHDR